MNKSETINEEMYLKELVEKCILSLDEYRLLPEDEKLEYCHLHFSSLVNLKLDEEKSRCGYMPLDYSDYFHKCGCKIENYDFGIEEFIIKKTQNLEFVSNKEAKERLYKYLLVIVQERLKALSVNDELYLKDEDINDIIFDKLPIDIKEKMISISINHFLESKKPIVDIYIDDCYLNALKDLGYGLVDSNSRFSKIYRLDKKIN